jgi:molybdenum cofactor cytidylyltransferase
MPESGAGRKSPLKVAAVVLAAGASRRLGKPKQRLQIDGESLLHRTARLALAAGWAPVFVVLGFEAEQMQADLGWLPVTVVRNPRWLEGMGASLRVGVHAAAAIRPKVDALLVLVCDQPRLTQHHLQTLLAHCVSGRAAIIASQYAGQTGVPAVFGREFFPQLQAVEGDRGAREVLVRESARLQAVAWPDGAFDLDTPQQLNTLFER